MNGVHYAVCAMGVATTLFLMGCSEEKPPTTFPNNPVAAEVNNKDLDTLTRKYGISGIYVWCGLSINGTPENAKALLRVSYEFAYGKRRIITDKECTGDNLIDIYYVPVDRYNHKERYAARTAENYSYETVKHFINMVYTDIDAKAQLPVN